MLDRDGCIQHEPALTTVAAKFVGGLLLPNLFLATGHGTLGWTIAAGTARVISEVISGRPPAIDMSGL